MLGSIQYKSTRTTVTNKQRHQRQGCVVVWCSLEDNTTVANAVRVPESLRTAILEGFEKPDYGRFLECCDALEAGTITSAVAQRQMSEIMNVPSNPIFRPSLFLRFVQWSTPYDTVKFEDMTYAEIHDDLRKLDNALTIMLISMEFKGPVGEYWKWRSEMSDPDSSIKNLKRLKKSVIAPISRSRP